MRQVGGWKNREKSQRARRGPCGGFSETGLAEGVRRSGDPDRDGRPRGETRSRPGRVTHIFDHCSSLGNGEGFVGKFCGAYCPTLRPPRGRPSRIKSRECPVLRSEAPGSDLSLGSAVGMVRVRGARVDRRAFFADGGKANARALWRDRVLSPRARACASRGRTSRLAKKRRGFGGDSPLRGCPTCLFWLFSCDLRRDRVIIT